MASPALIQYIGEGVAKPDGLCYNYPSTNTEEKIGMFTLPDHFKVFLSRIEPEDARVQAAQYIPDQLRDFLQDSQDITTVEPHSRLAGSYARHTATKDIKDVDIILFIAPEYRKQSPGDVLKTLFQALQDLPEALDDKGEVTIRRQQRRSVNVHLENADFDLDIVPAVALGGITSPLEIPDKEWSKWVRTHPLGYGERLSELNKANDEKVVPLVKILKHWRDIHMIYRRPKSYWLECMVYHNIADDSVSTDAMSYAELFRDLLGSIYDDFLSDLNKDRAVPRVNDLGHNVAHNWERDDFEAFMDRVKESHGRAKRALEQDDETDAISLWRKEFGDAWFPEDVEQERANSLRSAALAGSIYITPSGRVLTEKPTGRYVKPPIPRFYGED